MLSLRRLLLISRPMLWPIPALLFLVGVQVAGAPYSATLILQAVAVMILYSFAGYAVNDIYDVRSDKRNPRKGGMHGAVLTQREAKQLWTIIWCCIVALLITAVMTANIVNVIVLCAMLVIGLMYSTPPIRLKEHPPFDALANGAIYWWGPVFLGTTFGTISPGTTTKLCLIGFGVVAAHMYTTIIDYTPDKRAGQVTFAIRFGPRVTAGLGALIILGILFAASWPLLAQVFSILAIVVFGVTALLPVRIVERFANIAALVLYALFIVAALAFVILPHM